MSWTEYGKGKISRCSIHSSGWKIDHCGHPTATWSWSATSPRGEFVVAWHGHAWRSIITARKHIEQAVLGERVMQTRGPTWDRGPARLARVIEMTDVEALKLCEQLNDDLGCVAYVGDGRVRFVGSDHGEHSLDIWSSSRGRVADHWAGYVGEAQI